MRIIRSLWRFCGYCCTREAEEVLLEIIERYRIWKGTSGSRRISLFLYRPLKGYIFLPYTGLNTMGMGG